MNSSFGANASTSRSSGFPAASASTSASASEPGGFAAANLPAQYRLYAHQAERLYTRALNDVTPFVTYRWAGFGVGLFLFFLRIIALRGTLYFLCSSSACD